MTEISGNLPAQAHSLVKTAVNKTLAQALGHAEMYGQQFGGGNFISFNKQPIEVGSVLLYTAVHIYYATQNTASEPVVNLLPVPL